MRQAKVCPICQKPFNRRPNISSAQWHQQQYCSPKCAHLSMRKRKTLICAHCGTAFETYASSKRRFCCRQCANQGKQYSPSKAFLSLGSKQKAIAGRRAYWREHKKIEARMCEHCNKTFETRPKSHQRFCSRHCKDHWWSEHRLEIVTCPGCGTQFKRTSKNKQKKKYCTGECYHRNITQENNPNWQGGPCYYGPGWDEKSDMIRERDKTCRDCGKTPEENRVALDVHHIIPIRDFNGDFVAANDPTNLVALCKRCHRIYQVREY